MTTPPLETPSQLPTTSLAWRCMASSPLFMDVNPSIKKLISSIFWSGTRTNNLEKDGSLVVNSTSSPICRKKRGGIRTLMQEDKNFKKFIENNELVDMDPTNGMYT
jgi:hypothetical protein